MLKTKTMAKVQVYALKRDMKKIVNLLYKLKVYHISKPKTAAENYFRFEDSEKIAEYLNKTRSIINSQQKQTADVKSIDKAKINKNAFSYIDVVYDNIKDLKEQEKEIMDNIQKLKEKIAVVASFAKSPFSSMPKELFDLKKAAVVFGTAQNIDDVNEKIAKKTKKYFLWSSQKNCAVVLPAELKGFAMQLISPVDINSYLDAENSKSIDDFLSKLKKRLSAYEAELADIKKKQNLTPESLKKVLSLKKALEQELEKAESPLLFGHSKDIFYIDGYVPEDNVNKLNKSLNSAIGKNYLFKHKIVSRHEEAPIAFDHKHTTKPFEFFLELYSLPKYSEIDPTSIMFFTFPMIFGAMLGDIGYGLITLVAFMLLKKIIPKAKGFFNILIWASLWTMLFGFVFGEFFGAEELFGFEIPALMHRMHELNALLAFAIAIGVFHVNLGLIIGFINEYKHHGLKHAIFAKASWIVLQIGVLFLGLSLLNKAFLYVGIAVTLAAIVMLYLGEGINGLVELPGIFGNLLSYARIMAIGLASAGLAVVVNDFASEFIKKGVFGIIAAVLLLVVGHGINILLGIIGPFLHSLRLHYVEQFTKFYSGGGKPYKAFGDSKS